MLQLVQFQYRVHQLPHNLCSGRHGGAPAGLGPGRRPSAAGVHVDPRRRSRGDRRLPGAELADLPAHLRGLERLERRRRPTTATTAFRFRPLERAADPSSRVELSVDQARATGHVSSSTATGAVLTNVVSSPFVAVHGADVTGVDENGLLVVQSSGRVDVTHAAGARDVPGPRRHGPVGRPADRADGEGGRCVAPETGIGAPPGRSASVLGRPGGVVWALIDPPRRRAAPSPASGPARRELGPAARSQRTAEVRLRRWAGPGRGAGTGLADWLAIRRGAVDGDQHDW